MPYEKGQKTKELIFTCAKKCMYDLGYKKTTIQKIAEMANVPAGLVNYYFKKNDILENIYYDFFNCVDDYLNDTLGDKIENAIMRHILFTEIILHKIFHDKKELVFNIEIIKEDLFPNKVYDLIREKYAVQTLIQFNLSMPFDKYYLLNFAEYGACKELLISNAALNPDEDSFKEFVNLLATVTVRLAGIDGKIIDKNIKKANELFKYLDFRRPIFLNDSQK